MSMRWHDPQQPPMIMGILNATPDSFSDGGSYLDVEAAVAHATGMLDEGAEIIDVGGESTRPGAVRQSAAVQIERVVPVVRALRTRLRPDAIISIDTSLAEVAAAALDAGADMINDVSAGRDSQGMFALAAARRVPIVLMHMQGEPATMQIDPHYDDVVAEVGAFLVERARAARAAGVAADDILLDPGIGFGKRRRDNLAILAGLSHLAALGYPVLLGASRKRFMGSLCNEGDPRELLGATCASSALAVAAGVRVLRVHDVRPNRQAADVAWHLGRQVAEGAGRAGQACPANGTDAAAQTPTTPPRIAAVILAAGRSRRMGGPNKLCCEVDGLPMVRQVAQTALGSRCAQTFVVTGHDAAGVERALQGCAVSLVHNAAFDEGMAASLRRGLRALPDDIDAALILLGDMPRLRPPHLDAILAAYDPAAPAMVVPRRAGRRGNPVLWPRRWFDELATLQGEQGGRVLLQRHADLVRFVDLDDDAIFADVDTPEALARGDG